MPGKPAARVGDQTAHGGVIMPPGNPMVLIGGMPAACMGDMHTCPMLNPGVPPPPHVGGNIVATCTSVLIGGKPAARMGDTAVCSGPPSSIVAGCPTVLIGDGGGGGGGGAGGGDKAKASTKTAEVETEENHRLDVKFTDKGGKPITGVKYSVKGPDNTQSEGTLTGQVKQSGLKEGDHEIALKAIVKAHWSAQKAKDGEKVKMQAEAAGVDPKEKAAFEIWQKDANRADRQIGAVAEVEVNGGKAEAEWTYDFGDEDVDEEETQKDSPNKFSSPLYYFIVKIDGVQARSALLEYNDTIEIELLDDEDKPASGEAYKVYLPSGEVRKGKLDSNGKATEKGIRPGPCQVEFPESGDVD